MEFLKKDFAGLPIGIWLVIVAVGAGVTYFLPKIMNKGSSDTTSSDTTSSDGTGLPPAQLGDGSSSGVDFSPVTDLLNQLIAAETAENTTSSIPPTQPCPKGMHRTRSGKCKCNGRNMVNMGTHCEKKGKTSPPDKKKAVHGGGNISEEDAMEVAANSEEHIMPPIPVIKRHPITGSRHRGILERYPFNYEGY